MRQFHDWKGGADVERHAVPGATLYARICGATLARAHARWGDRIAIASYLGKGDAFDRAIAEFAVAYADQNERDYAAFAAAVESGRLPARPDIYVPATTPSGPRAAAEVCSLPNTASRRSGPNADSSATAMSTGMIVTPARTDSRAPGQRLLDRQVERGQAVAELVGTPG